MLVSGAEAVDLARRMHRRGIAGEPRIDWKELIAFRRSFTDPVPHNREQGFAKQGITALHGMARFAAPDTVAVEGRSLQGRHILIASGARPAALGFAGAEHLTPSDAFTELERLPRRIVMVGGGYIATEISHIAARAGAKVTVLQRGARMLPNFDPDLVAWLMEKFQEIGVDVRTGHTVKAIERAGDQSGLHAQTSEGEANVEGDLVVYAAGRVADIAELNLSAAHDLSAADLKAAIFAYPTGASDISSML